jgi:iron complex outermembrane receptor protein
MHQIHWLASTAALALLAGQVHAQTAAPTVPGVAAASDIQLVEIVVTAQKRSESIQQVPLSIMAVSGEALANAGINDPTELEKVVPTLQVTPGFLGSQVQIAIRGFGTTGETATDSDVASYVDSAFIPRPGAILSSFLDMNSIEVLSGPQGTLFGRNAAMGAISMTTNAASTKEATLDLKVEGGSFGTFSGTAIGNLPISNDFALRLAILGSHTDGDYHNELDGKTYGKRDQEVGRISAHWDVSPDVTWNLRVDGAVTDGDGVYPLAVYTKTASASQLAALNSFVTSNGGTPPVESNNPSYTFNQVFGSAYSHDNQYGINSDVNWNLSPVLTARLIDSYRDWNDSQLGADSIGTSLNMLAVFEGHKSVSQNHELQLISPKGAFLNSRLGFTAGAYYFHEDYTAITAFDLGPQFCSVLLTTVGVPFLIPACEAAPQNNVGRSHFLQATDSYAGYIQVNFEIAPNVEFDSGVRQTWDRKSGTYVGVLANPIAAGPIISPEGPEQLKFTDSKPSFREALSWHATDTVMSFASYSTGYKSGGFDSGPAVPALNPTSRTFGSETVDNYEVGVKSMFLDRKLLLNATVFDTELHNYQAETFTGTQLLVRNAGDATSRGLDINGQVLAMPSLKFTYGATYLSAFYAKNLNAPGLEGCTGAPGCPLVQNLSGRPLDFAPHWRGNVGAEWTSGTFMGGYIATFAASENYSSSFLTQSTDNPQSRLPGWYTTDLRVFLSSPDAHWQFGIFGKNVFDQHYYVNTVPQILGTAIPGVTNPATGATVFRGFLGAPAIFGASLAYHF